MKALFHIAPREGASDVFARAVASLADELREQPAAEDVSITVLQRLADDPLGAKTDFRGMLELASGTASAADLAALFAGIDQRIAAFADPARSALLLGEEVVFIASERAPIRYQYLMRRRSDFDHAAYLERYREVHSAFGMRTPGLLGYVQFHVDLDASRAAAARGGIGIWEIDSVSELHLASVAEFFAAVSGSPVPAEAAADEARFVDRASSRQYISRVEWPAAQGSDIGVTA